MNAKEYCRRLEAERSKLLIDLGEVKYERDQLRTELENIAQANPAKWGEMSDQFQAWAQSRARHALGRLKGETE